MKKIFVFLMLAVFLAAPAFAEPCDGCKDAEMGRKRAIGTPTNAPEAGVVCVYLAMPDPCDSVVVEVDTPKGTKKVRDYGLGAVVAMATGSVPSRSGKPSCVGSEKAMACVPRGVLEGGATEVRLIPGNKGTCAILRPAHIAELLRRGTVPSSDPVRLGWKEPGARAAPAGF